MKIENKQNVVKAIHAIGNYAKIKRFPTQGKEAWPLSATVRDDMRIFLQGKFEPDTIEEALNRVFYMLDLNK